MATYTSDELSRFIEAAGESNHIDAKGPMEWDAGESAAGLTKHILAFANSRDGGVLVIGKEEDSPGKFVLTGLTSEQADSFETTKVASWVNSRCAPPVHLVCYRILYDEKEFIVLTVAEFDDVPVLCTKQYEVSGKRDKAILRKGAIYVRTANAESAPLSSIEDLRTLVGIATTNRADQMLSMFQAMMKGRPLLSQKSDEESWSEQAELVQSDLDSQLGKQKELGCWAFRFHPSEFRKERWEEAEELKALVKKHAVRLHDEFPGIHYDGHVREWGICSHEHQDVFGLTRLGLFVANRIFREDTEIFKNSGEPNKDIPAGQWLDFQWNMAQVIEFFMFMSRFCHEFEAGEEVTYDVMAFPLMDRLLVSLNPRHFLFMRTHQKCRASEFRLVRTSTVEMLQSAWEDECARTLLRFFELFGSNRIDLNTIHKFIQRFKDRTFWR